jgi:hypothetical protein
VVWVFTGVCVGSRMKMLSYWGMKKKKYNKILCELFYMFFFLILVILDHRLYLTVENDFPLVPHRWGTYSLPHLRLHHLKKMEGRKSIILLLSIQNAKIDGIIS